MKKIMIVAVASLLLIEMGCKKKNADPVPTPQIACQPDDEVSCLQNKNYFPLTKGSYWIYEKNNYDRFNNLRSPISEDSCFILERDSVVDGKRYFIMGTFSKNYTGTYRHADILYRYEGDYVIGRTDKEYKIFSYCKTDDVLYPNTYENPLFNSEFRILGKDSSITVQAGTFETRSTQKKYTRSILSETNPDDLYRYYDIYYGKNVGLVYSLCPYTSSPDAFQETRLLRYYIGGN